MYNFYMYIFFLLYFFRKSLENLYCKSWMEILVDSQQRMLLEKMVSVTIQLSEACARNLCNVHREYIGIFFDFARYENLFLVHCCKTERRCWILFFEREKKNFINTRWFQQEIRPGVWSYCKYLLRKIRLRIFIQLYKISSNTHCIKKCIKYNFSITFGG